MCSMSVSTKAQCSMVGSEHFVISIPQVWDAQTIPSSPVGTKTLELKIITNNCKQ